MSENNLRQVRAYTFDEFMAADFSLKEDVSSKQENEAYENGVTELDQTNFENTQ